MICATTEGPALVFASSYLSAFPASFVAYLDFFPQADIQLSDALSSAKAVSPASLERAVGEVPEFFEAMEFILFIISWPSRTHTETWPKVMPLPRGP